MLTWDQHTPLAHTPIPSYIISMTILRSGCNRHISSTVCLKTHGAWILWRPPTMHQVVGMGAANGCTDVGGIVDTETLYGITGNVTGGSYYITPSEDISGYLSPGDRIRLSGSSTVSQCLTNTTYTYFLRSWCGFLSQKCAPLYTRSEHAGESSNPTCRPMIQRCRHETFLTSSIPVCDPIKLPICNLGLNARASFSPTPRTIPERPHLHGGPF